MLTLLRIPTCILTSLLFCKINFAQTINYLDSSQKGISFRGLSVVTNSIFWLSGSKGMVGKTVDGGQHFTWTKPKGFEKTDFRDIEAFDEKTAIIMGIDSPGVILKTKDGGANWKTVYRSDAHGMFLDAMAFKNSMRGVCVGDPIDDKFWLVETNDGGESWIEVDIAKRPIAEKGEACFASSGTNVQFLDGNALDYAFVSGGKKTNFYLIGKELRLVGSIPIQEGQETTGANSLAIDGQNFYIAGGDFNNHKRSDSTAIMYWPFKNNVLQTPTHKPFGYKSCVIFKDSKTLIATGLSGTDISSDVGKDWKHFSDEPFHVVQKAKKGTCIYLAGGNGRIAKIMF